MTTDLVPRRPATVATATGRPPARPTRDGRIVAIGAIIGGPAAAVPMSGGAGWSWPLAVVGLVAGILAARRPR